MTGVRFVKMPLSTGGAHCTIIPIWFWFCMVLVNTQEGSICSIVLWYDQLYLLLTQVFFTYDGYVGTRTFMCPPRFKVCLYFCSEKYSLGPTKIRDQDISLKKQGRLPLNHPSSLCIIDYASIYGEFILPNVLI